MVSDPSSVDDALTKAAAAVQAGADLIEWRVDGLIEASPGWAAVETLVRDCPSACILTARCTEEGGQYAGTDADLAAWLSETGKGSLRPAWIDVEFVRLARSGDIRDAVAAIRQQGGRVLASFHDFTGQPSDLARRALAMQQSDVDAVKLVWRARSLRDCVDCAELLAQRTKPMVALCMGPFGVLSRVMTGVWGGLMSFASLDAASGTAPGQVTIADMVKQYRFRSLGPGTGVYGLIGDPLGDSPGFSKHNAAFEAAEVDAVYLPLPVAAGWESLKGTLATLIESRKVSMRGASVTLPHKHDLVRFARDRGGEMSELATQCGAANTMTIDAQGRLRIDNTDVAGILEPLRDRWRAREDQLEDATAVVLGAGGVARAAVVALLAAGCRVAVVNRTPDRAAQLARDVAGCGVVDLKPPGDRVDIVVQATSVGMAHGEHADESAMTAVGCDAAVLLDGHSVFFETIYDPVETPAATEARARGADIVTGGDMWRAQAAAQQLAWTGGTPSEDVWPRLGR